MNTTISALEELETIQLGPDDGLMHIMDKTGDFEVRWNRKRPVEVKEARKTFERMVKTGYTGYAGDRLLAEFDPDVERIVMSPRNVGG